ncbi:DUF1450 domain-containing protein [Collinsella tanakaei]|uniref:DUF1450 domain-containing protein n=1 Tax=Collinsella tanakaei TaxID=626935 RepID=UPI00195B944E|nr:DUF1450 domain-containing protein [Collinsella tanakaei]MBM6755350.1 DUF1450 domain-containing protein [Collinsella tanakaei]
MGKPHVKFCKKCSGIKPKDLKGELDKDAWKEGCIHHCVKKHATCPFARIDGELVMCDSKKELIKKLKKAAVA